MCLGPLSQPHSSSQCFQNDLLWCSPSARRTSKSHREQSLDPRKGEGQFWYPTLSTENFSVLRDYKLSIGPDCILKTSQLWQEVFSRMCSKSRYNLLTIRCLLFFCFFTSINIILLGIRTYVDIPVYLQTISAGVDHQNSY